MLVAIETWGVDTESLQFRLSLWAASGFIALTYVEAIRNLVGV